jgi:hypothetical protein
LNSITDTSLRLQELALRELKCRAEQQAAAGGGV